MPAYTYRNIPPSRIATFDIFSIGLAKHHVAALLELDVTESRAKLKAHKHTAAKISFTAWLIKVLSTALSQHPAAAAYLYNKRKLMLFNDINISMIVEKKLGDARVPIPLVIPKTQEKSAAEITQIIEQAKNQPLSDHDIVLNKSAKFYEKLYYHLPGFMRRMIWRYLLRHPKIAFKNMGNAIVTSLGMIGTLHGWFMHKSVHPISFGVGAIVKKPWVVNDAIQIREILNMTILMDHDVIDGAPMVRFVNDLSQMLEKGAGL
ncbi:MAG: 2-oxo acid dehydrogenase subunit E2 [Saprospiraceae bacterium]